MRRVARPTVSLPADKPLNYPVKMVALTSYVYTMSHMSSRTNRDGKPIKLVLGWLAGREVSDGELAKALGVDKTYYSRHKDDDDYPSFEDLEKFGAHFGFDPRVLQINFGYRDVDELILLDYQGMHEYMELGGGNYPHPEREVVLKYVETVIDQLHRARASMPWDAESTTPVSGIFSHKHARIDKEYDAAEEH